MVHATLPAASIGAAGTGARCDDKRSMTSISVIISCARSASVLWQLDFERRLDVDAVVMLRVPAVDRTAGFGDPAGDHRTSGRCLTEEGPGRLFLAELPQAQVVFGAQTHIGTGPIRHRPPSLPCLNGDGERPALLPAAAISGSWPWGD